MHKSVRACDGQPTSPAKDRRKVVTEEHGAGRIDRGRRENGIHAGRIFDVFVAADKAHGTYDRFDE